MSQKLHRVSVASQKATNFGISHKEEGDIKRENVEKTGQGNRRGVSFRLILQILRNDIGLLQMEKQATTRGKKKKSRTATTIMMLSLQRKSPSPERKVRRIPGVRLTRSCGNDSLNVAVSHWEWRRWSRKHLGSFLSITASIGKKAIPSVIDRFRFCDRSLWSEDRVA